MITLKEFIMDTFTANTIEFDDQKVKDMEKEITKYARDKAAGQQSIGIADDEIRQFILDSKPLLERLKNEREQLKQRSAELNKEIEQKKAKEKERKASEDSQMYSLFDE